MAVHGNVTGAARAIRAGLHDIRLSDGLRLADAIEDVFGVPTWDYQVGKVSEIGLPAVDVDGKLSKARLLREGVSLTFQSSRWEVAAIERDYKEDIWLTFTARSALARRLRSMTGPDKTSGKVTPGSWITGKARRAGAQTVKVEQGASRRVINQKRTQSVLAVIEALASDTGVEWVEFDNRLYVGTAWWAFQGKTGLPTWVAPVGGSGFSNDLQVAGLQTRSSLDDRGQAATATMTVEPDSGVRVRPWHRVKVTRADPADNGLWLVTGNQFDGVKASAQLNLSRPLKSSPKKGSTGRGGTQTGSPSALDGQWIEGADKTWPHCTRTPRQYVAWARSQVGSGFGYNMCLAWVSIAVSGTQGRGGAYARYVWERAPASAVKSPGDTNPPIGAIVVWGPPTGGGAGHVGISVGGGRFISATGGRVVELNIAGFGSYYGAMTPSFFQ